MFRETSVCSLWVMSKSGVETRPKKGFDTNEPRLDGRGKSIGVLYNGIAYEMRLIFGLIGCCNG